MEVSLLVGALGFFAYSIISPSLRMKLTGEELRCPVNRYFGDNLESSVIDFSRVSTHQAPYGALVVTKKNVSAMCGDNYWAKCKAKMLIN